ncbi:MAG: ribosome-binding factor A [Alphaproteobacteria bacterium]|nr:ribosome-binding factor A [Alphaproteobacteria bacterium]MCL2758112.1 ribosome-binding factor A [Alphaproteobacteria bacterium]
MKTQKNSNRGDRIAVSVRRQVAEILQTDFADDALLSRVSIVDADSGMQFIKLFYYARGGKDDNIQKRLDTVTPRIRHELAARIDQKYVPNIRFVYDDTLEKSERIDKLLRNI